jgi:hypothetical protein
MKWIRKGYSKITTARGKGFYFTCDVVIGKGYYVLAIHTKKDIRFNSLWDSLTFETELEAQKFCETFDYSVNRCLGKDVIEEK